MDRFFDYAAGAPPLPEALRAQAQAAERWFGNPSAAHGPGRAARVELERLRERLSELCGFRGGRLVLTSGATEANNWAIHGAMAQRPVGRILVAPDVHASVWNSCQRYRDHVDVLPVDPQGRIRLQELVAAITPAVGLLCCSHVASETGVVQDVGAITAVCERRGIPCLVDGTQALGRLPVDLSAIAADFYTFSSHKFGGSRGCGGAFLNSGAVTPLMDGGAQEWGLRPGTENLPALAGAVVALERALSRQSDEAVRLRELTRRLLSELGRAGVAHRVNGDPDATAPGFLSLAFRGVDGHALVADLAVQGFAVAVGSACGAHLPEPSRAVLAMGRSRAEALGTARISLGRTTQPEAVDAFAHALVATVRRHEMKVASGIRGVLSIG